MNTDNPKRFYRWVLLRHIGAPDDERGIHFDLLLEEKDFCKTWRLSDIPILDGPYVDCVSLPPHGLDWLDIEERVVSGNRGVATRVKKGIFLQLLPTTEQRSITVSLKWEDIVGDLLINKYGCRILRKKNNISCDLKGLEFL